MSLLVADDYDAFLAGVRRLTQIDLTQYKRGQMERRVRTWVERRGGGADLAAYLVRLRSEPAELEAFLDRVTINVSQLWRNPEQWDLLARDVLPELAAGGGSRLRAWSAGCSYGAEAYTLAATCATHLPRTRTEILGTDIDRRMVDRARAGVFSSADARDAPAAGLRAHFERVPEGLRASAALRAMTQFETGDLLRMTPRAGSYDLVLCRNTVIYFNEPIRDALHARLVAALRPGGYLIIGSTERVADPRGLGLTAIQPFTYRKDA